jgi:glucose uptake protein GlcU
LDGFGGVVMEREIWDRYKKYVKYAMIVSIILILTGFYLSSITDNPHSPIGFYLIFSGSYCLIVGYIFYIYYEIVHPKGDEFERRWK